MTSDRRSIASYAHSKPHYSPLSRQLPRIMNQTMICLSYFFFEQVSSKVYRPLGVRVIHFRVLWIWGGERSLHTVKPYDSSIKDKLFKLFLPGPKFSKNRILSKERAVFVFTDLKVTAVLLPTRPHANLSPWCLSAVAQFSPVNRVKCFFDVYWSSYSCSRS